MQEFIRCEIPVTTPPLVHYKHVCSEQVVGYYSKEDMETMRSSLHTCLEMNLSDEIRADVNELLEAIEKALNA